MAGTNLRMPGTLVRSSRIVSLTIADNAALSQAFDFSGYSGGMVLIPNGWVAANLGFKVSPDDGGTFDILRDDVGTPVQVSGILTTGARWYKLPDDLFGVLWAKLWSKSTTAATETDTNQTGGPLAITVMLKG